MSVEISSVFAHHRVSGFSSSKPTMTQQNFKRECDINVIMQRYLEGDAPLVDPLKVRSSEPLFGDFSDIPDLQTAQNKLIEANDMFMQLNSNIRLRFNNDPLEFVAFVQNPDNEDELRELGILPKIYRSEDGQEYYFRDGKPVFIPKSVVSAPEEPAT